MVFPVEANGHTLDLFAIAHNAANPYHKEIDSADVTAIINEIIKLSEAATATEINNARQAYISNAEALKPLFATYRKENEPEIAICPKCGSISLSANV